ncbi:F-box protein [Pleurostoma richardsiae]|uniref:Glycerophosphocholine acyltransferase 1 n=1 Tax=Pleurostoma richardsiae TaxID=41990 RepID=A0AA38VNC4_9PEZI|nr:F-box protein [Pleurostoma richardsiae]
MAEAAESETLPIPISGNRSDAPSTTDSETALTPDPSDTPGLSASPPEHAVTDTPTMGPTTPGSKSPRISRNPSFSGSSSYQEDWEAFPPLDRLTMLDILDNFALPQQLEKLSKGISAQTEKIRKSRDAFKSRSEMARERMVEEWRKRVPTAEEQLERYRSRMRKSVDKLGRQWNDTKIITMREKVSFIFGVMNIFVSGYLIGAFPEYFHLWYTVQILYFMPIRFVTYHRRGYHYFLADLCYFVNFLLMLSLWVFPGSKRLFTAVYCLAFGNNAVAIVMWRNSLVFHSFDKVTSLFIHIMPCVTLHCIVHLLPPEKQKERFPAIWTIKNSPPGSPTAYANEFSMLAWSTIPYAVWQLAYYFFITVRRREKIAAGRPTSFTWLRKSYSKTWIGRLVLSLPEVLQESAFMLIQYLYAVVTMFPCPIWFRYRWASATFLLAVFTWSIYNGATFYIDVFGKRFQKELEALKAEVSKWQTSPEPHGAPSPLMTPHAEAPSVVDPGSDRPARPKSGGLMAEIVGDTQDVGVDSIPLLSDERSSSDASASGIDGGVADVVRERKGSEATDS